MTFTSGPGLIEPVVGDPSREAIASLRGYAYQLYLSALAWIGLSAGEVLHLEVAEDYAVATRDALKAVQVKDAAASGNLTLRNKDVIQAIDNFVHLHSHNPGRQLTLRFLSTAEIGREKAVADRPGGVEGLIYWRRAAKGAAVEPLRKVLKALPLDEKTLKFIDDRTDEALRKDLLQRLHWDAARPDFLAVKEEFDLAIVTLGQRNGLTVNECRQLGGTLLMTALDTIVTPGSRRLLPHDLQEKLEAATHLAVPRRQLEGLLQQAQGGFGSAPNRSILVAEQSTALPRLLAPRTPLVDQIVQALDTDGVAMLTASTGAGKTLLARLASRKRAGDWRIVDLYGLEPRSLAARLDEVLAVNALEAFDGLILDDLNGHQDPGVERALARLAEGLRRRDRRLVITSYQAPSSRLRDALGIEPEAAIPVSRLTTLETAELVVAAEGDPDRWARAIHLAAGPGHPQLVQAMIADFRRRGWPMDEVGKLERLELGDLLLADERETARRRLVQAASPDARKLLYRLGVALGPFQRPLALELGGLPPPVTDPGVCLDDLIGPWIDRLASGRLRLSPLLGGLAQANLPEAEITAVRRRIAEVLVGGQDLDVQNVGEAFVQALASSAEPELTRIAIAVLSTNVDELSKLAGWLMPLRAVRTDQPIYPANTTVSWMLRLGQVLLEASVETPGDLSAAWQALKAELATEPDEDARESFECMALSKVLLCRSFARDVDDWLAWLVRFDHLTRKNEKFRSVMGDDKRVTPGREGNVVGFMFHYLALSLPSVETLLKCFEDLDRLDGEVRSRILSDLDRGKGDASVLLNHAWVSDRDHDRLDGAKAAESYRRIAEIAEGWGEPDLATRALIARAVMFDEYLDDRDQANAALDDAEKRFGPQVAISRGRAKIFFRRKDHAAALDLVETLADQLGDDLVERAYVFREAGISAGELKRWSEARQWFTSARDAASRTQSDAMEAMAVGLLGDIAVAARHCGDDVGAIQLLAQALEALNAIDPEETVKGAYVYHAVGHAVAWLNGELTQTRYDDEQGEPFQSPPGFCSNPDPPESIKDRPRLNLAAAWYMLTLADIAIDGLAGEADRLSTRLGGKIILGMEATVRQAQMACAIRAWKTAAFPDLAERYMEAILWLRDEAAMDPGGGLAVLEAGFPKPSATSQAEPKTADTVANLLIHVAVNAVMDQRTDVLTHLRAIAAHLKAAGYPGVDLVDRATGAPSDAEAKALAAWLALAGQGAPTPQQVWVAGFYLLDLGRLCALSGARFEEAIDHWVRTTWQFVIDRQRFLLASPPLGEERVRAVLASERHGYGLLARMLRDMHEQVRIPLQPEVLAYLNNG